MEDVAATGIDLSDLEAILPADLPMTIHWKLRERRTDLASRLKQLVLRLKQDYFLIEYPSGKDYCWLRPDIEQNINDGLEVNTPEYHGSLGQQPERKQRRKAR